MTDKEIVKSIVEINEELDALEFRKQKLVSDLNRIRLEKITGLIIPENIQNIEFDYSCDSIGVTRPQILITFNGNQVYPKSLYKSSKYSDFTSKIKELVQDPKKSLSKTLYNLGVGIPSRKYQPNYEASWILR